MILVNKTRIPLVKLYSEVSPRIRVFEFSRNGRRTFLGAVHLQPADLTHTLREESMEKLLSAFPSNSCWFCCKPGVVKIIVGDFNEDIRDEDSVVNLLTDAGF